VQVALCVRQFRLGGDDLRFLRLEPRLAGIDVGRLRAVASLVP
jgi:hypothetical protein